MDVRYSNALLWVCLFVSISLPWLQKDLPVPRTPFYAADLPNDPELLNELRSYAPQLLNLLAAWKFVSHQTPVIIAVLDSGIALDHPEFAGRILPGYDFVNNDADPTDDHGHGTHVSGIIAAATDNGEGVAGVCGFCQLMPVKVLNESREGSAAGIAAGIYYAVDHGAQIIALSLGRSIGSQTVLDAVNYAHEHDVLLVAAAGNDGVDIPFYPAAYPDVLAVNATDRFDQKLKRSNFGSYIAVAAPGDNIYSTYHKENGEHGRYAYMSGTSMAAPFVAGVAGLLLAQNPERSAADLRQLITSTAVDLGEPGWDPIYGYGRVDPVAALQAEVPLPDTLVQLKGTVRNGDASLASTQPSGVDNVEITLRKQNHLVGLTNTRSDGTWQWVATVPATYTINIRYMSTTGIMSVAERSIVLTSTTSASDLDFLLTPTPIADSIENSSVVRQGGQVQLSWMVPPLVNTLQIERSTQADGVYSRVGTVTVENLTAASAQVQFTDVLPSDLSTVTLFYRVLLEPGNILTAPIAVEPEPNMLFLPLVTN
jgi:hypothetical protein